ncbi:Fe-S cluster assembly protein SufD [Catalinimonas alkaloidigena]|uniref:Fe-S cluster assembly protein SufD n=1 Tax=Catalinimonas alkaloidigena TaxID=1075417 RepID=A0A1G9NAG4_9BACT|nr:Fe-S cluster assembly protein SufD [Catalinimonas alkaloidigena]SDL83450.1 Fe-S cluster assembly protein SufD [Catalinimonas alkaloidigena]
MATVTDQQDLKALCLEHFAQVEEKNSPQSQSALQQQRRAAMEAFQALDFPTTKHEEWKYTNVAPLLKTPYDLKQNEAVSSMLGEERQQLFDIPEANVLVFVNGNYEAHLSRILSPVHELTLLNLASAEEKNEPALYEHFGKLADAEHNAFTALNTGFSQQGAYFYVPKGQEVERPIIIHYVSDAKRGPVLSNPRNLFVVGANSRVQVIENFVTLGDQPAFDNAVTEIYVSEGAFVDYYKLQNCAPAASHVGTTQVHQERNSHFDSFMITLQGQLIRNDLNIVLDGEGCEGHMYGLYLQKGKTHVDNHTLVDHRKPNSFSNELYKGILDDRATGVFNGKIYVRQDAQKTNAFQSNRNILLSEEATINTKPQLEIWADDVKCSHGATTGQLDEEALFYLRARGLGEGQAKAMLMHAFASDVVDKVRIEPLRNYLEQLITERLEGSASQD